MAITRWYDITSKKEKNANGDPLIVHRMHVRDFTEVDIMREAMKNLRKRGVVVRQDQLENFFPLKVEMAVLLLQEWQELQNGEMVSVPANVWPARMQKQDGIARFILAKGDELAAERDEDFELSAGN